MDQSHPAGLWVNKGPGQVTLLSHQHGDLRAWRNSSRCKHKSWGIKRDQIQQSNLWISLVLSDSVSDEAQLITLSCCISSETQEGGHINTINMLCAMCVTSKVELCQQVLGNFLLGNKQESA